MSIQLLLTLVLVGADFPICTAPSGSTYPAPVYANGQYNVFWVDQRLGNRWSIFGARVTKQGLVIDRDGKELYTDSASYGCDAASDGSNFLIVTRNHC